MDTSFLEEYIKLLKDECPQCLLINGHRFNKIKKISSLEDIRRGLMFVEQMNDDEIMIFYFDKSRVRNFWMKNTLIPLDVIFLDENKSIISIHSMNVEKQKDKNETEKLYEKRLKRYSSFKPCKYAIELKYGLSKKIGLHIGDFISFPN